ncbi:unnamed protein product, partial [Rotaria sordida]
VQQYLNQKNLSLNYTITRFDKTFEEVARDLSPAEFEARCRKKQQLVKMIRDNVINTYDIDFYPTAFKFDRMIVSVTNKYPAFDAVTELLDNNINEEIDQFCSDFNNAAHIETDGLLYSDGTNSLLACQVDADATIGNDGLKANAHTDGSLSKRKLENTDISVGQWQAYAKASIEADGMNAVIGAELNTVSLKNENIEANIRLSIKTGVDLSMANVSASAFELG